RIPQKPCYSTPRLEMMGLNREEAKKLAAARVAHDKIHFQDRPNNPYKGDFEPAHLAHENWFKLAGTPQDLAKAFEQMRTSPHLSRAIELLDAPEREMIKKRFQQHKPWLLVSIARDHKVSYAKVVSTLARTLSKLERQLKKSRRNTVV